MKRVVLAASEREYAAKLAEYLREEEPGWDIAAYTHASALRRELFEDRSVELLIGQPSLLHETADAIDKAGKILALVEERGTSGGPWQEVIQFQPLPAILSAIRDGLGAVSASPPPDCQVLTLFSSSGGAGKSTVALNLIRQAGERGLRTFYLNLEALNATSLLFGKGEPDSLSRLLYALQTHPEQGDALLNRLCRHQPYLRTDYLDAPDHPGERLALTPELTEMLLEKIRSTGKYDLIVIDPDSGAGEWYRKLLEASDRIVWLLLDDTQMLMKNEKLLRYWQGQMEKDEIVHKLIFAVNKGNVGGLVNHWSLSGGSPPSILPYVPQWKAIDQPGRLLASPAFSGAVDRLMDRLALGGNVPNSGRKREERHGIQRTHARGAV